MMLGILWSSVVRCSRTRPSLSLIVWLTAPARSRNIVTQISPTVSILRADDTDTEVYLIGTAHISDASANEITEMIELVKPQTVFVELDQARAAQLYHANEDTFEEEMKQAFAMMFSKNMPMLLPGMAEQQIKDYFRAIYKGMQKYGFIPGVDMLAAMKAATRHNANIVYGDKNASQTIRDMMKGFLSSPAVMMSLMTKTPPPEIETIWNLLNEGGIEKLGETVEMVKTRETTKMIVDWVATEAPEIADALLFQRDCYMVQKLRQLRGKVVAVVGVAHLDGMEREWLEYDDDHKSPSSSLKT